MSMLAGFREVFVPGGFPHERRYLSYLLKLARAVYVDSEVEKNDLSYLDSTSRCFSGNPFVYDDVLIRSGCDRVELSRDLFVSAALSIVMNLHKNAISSVFWAEKGIDQIEAMNRLRIEDWNCIRIVRDPRDMIISHVLFHKLDPLDPGIESFLLEYRAFLLSIMNKGVDDPRMFDCKYEDLVINRIESEDRLKRFLNIESNAMPLDSTFLDTNHMTSPTVLSSIGRYKNIEDQVMRTLVQRVNNLFEDQIKYFDWGFSS